MIKIGKYEVSLNVAKSSRWQTTMIDGTQQKHIFGLHRNFVVDSNHSIVYISWLFILGRYLFMATDTVSIDKVFGVNNEE